MLLATLWRMKRPVITAVFLFAVVGLAGCPVYDHEDAGCYRDSDCARGYICEQNGDCVAVSDTTTCHQPADCDTTSTCTPAGVCEVGDCTFYHGCVAGYRCDSSNGLWACVLDNGGAAGSGGQAAAGAAGETSMTSQGGAAGQTSESLGGAGGMTAGAGG